MLTVRLQKTKKDFVVDNCSACLKGGLAIEDINKNVVVCKGNEVKEYQGSFLSLSDDCKKQIGLYHKIDDSKTIIEEFLVYLNKNTKNDDKLPLLLNWLTSFKNANQIKNLSTFFPLFLRCKIVVDSELHLRTKHLQQCVCLSNLSHSERLNNCKKCSVLFENILKILENVWNKNNNSLIDDKELLRHFIYCTFIGNLDTAFIAKSINDFVNKCSFFEVNAEGKVEFSQQNLFFEDLLNFKQFYPSIESDINKKFLQKVETLIPSILNEPKNYQLFNLRHITCVELDTNSNFKKIGIDYVKLRDFISDKVMITIDAGYLASLVENKFKNLLYKTCFVGLSYYHYNIMRQICQNLNKLNIDADLKNFLQHLCSELLGLNLNNIKGNLSLEKLRVIVAKFPLATVIYSNFIASNPPINVKTTKNLMDDIMILPLTTIIDFMVYYEKHFNEYKEFLGEHKPKKQKKYHR